MRETQHPRLVTREAVETRWRKLPGAPPHAQTVRAKDITGASRDI